jgi:low temperature requirement protein LtrA
VGANWLDPDRLPVRLVLVGLMFASLLMSLGIADAFDGRAWLSSPATCSFSSGARPSSSWCCAAGRSASTSSTFSSGSCSSSLWVAGAIAEADARLLLWGLAVVAAHGGTWTLHWLPGRGRAIDLAHTQIAGAHLIERFRLFFIIVLGETVLATGNAFTDEPFQLERLLALAIGFAGTVALWWCYFQRTEGIGLELAEAADDAGAVGWWGTWTLTLIVLALIGIAVGAELAIAHPGDEPTLGFAILIFGGPALFLLAQVFFLREALGHVPRSRALGLTALAILALATTVRQGDQAPSGSA